MPDPSVRHHTTELPARLWVTLRHCTVSTAVPSAPLKGIRYLPHHAYLHVGYVVGDVGYVDVDIDSSYFDFDSVSN